MAKQSSLRNFLIDVGRTGPDEEEGADEDEKNERADETIVGRTHGRKEHIAARGVRRRRRLLLASIIAVATQSVVPQGLTACFDGQSNGLL